MSTDTTTAPDLAAKQRALWALGDYAAVADQVIPTLGPTLVNACRIHPGDDVLDVAAGCGNAALPAAEAGAHVVASDITPQLLEVGRQRAADRGIGLQWREADAQNLPFADSSFDAVISCVGVMFAPYHRTSADEVIRVVRPGGTIGLISWTPEGFIGQMFATMKPFAPAPPPGAEPPPLWGRESHLAELFGDRVTDVVSRRRALTVDRFATAAEFRDFFKRNYGPTIAVYRAIADDEDRVRALDLALEELARRHDRGNGIMEWEYLLYTARVPAGTES